MIAIKGAMPENCAECVFRSSNVRYGRDMFACFAVLPRRTIAKAVPAERLLSRPSWCPLIEVKIEHSRWIKDGDEAKCEKCGREAAYQIVDNHWAYENFCPHCGSRMNSKEGE